ncbi:MAG: OmpA family protein [Salibacteraceae bacterium]
MDSEDDCPELAGPIESKGCPDTDGDGLTDNVDNCPETPGPIDNKGCPFGDRDGDGVIDKDDSCPDTPGPEENAGCPYSDLDGDGVYDKDDRCPQTPGIAENEGCPEIKEEEQEVLNTAFSNLEFEVGKDVIKQNSYESLDRLAELLVKKSDWKLEIRGHTDDVGSDAANMTLSEKRSKSVGKYLESKGVGTERLIVKWFGETQPTADNSTPEGRAQNRRVEMEVIFD